MRNRRGVSLIELVIVMSAGVTIMLAAIMLVHRALLIVEHANHVQRVHSAMQRLAKDVRHDVQNATALAAISENQVELVHGDASRIVFSINGRSLLRTQQWDDGKKRFETYLLPDNASVRWSGELSGNSSTRAIGLDIYQKLNAGARPNRLELQIKSVPGFVKFGPSDFATETVASIDLASVQESRP